MTAPPQRGFRSNQTAVAGECDETHVRGGFRLNPGDGGEDCDETHTGDGAIAALAARQCGVVTTAQLANAGIGERAVAHRVNTGRLTRLHRGVFQVGPIAAPRGREMAAVLATGGVLSHHSAAAVWGFRPPHTGDVHVTVKGARRPRSGVEVHRSGSLEAAVHHGLPLTPAARTLRDLRPLLPTSEYDRAHEQAQILRLVPKAPGDEPRFTRSEAERRLLALIRAAGLPAPLTNVKVAGYEVDCYWPRHKLVVEVDGYAFHGGRAAFERDRRKAADLAAAGLTPVPVTWQQIANETHRLVAQLSPLLQPLTA